MPHMPPFASPLCLQRASSLNDASQSGIVLGPSTLPQHVPARFDPRSVRDFVYKSLSDSTRRAYRLGIREFFAFHHHLHETLITPQHVISYRDHLIAKGKSANTVALRLSIVRSLFDYLLAAGGVSINPATTKLVAAPPVATEPAGRALTAQEVRYLLAGPDRTEPVGARDYALMLLMLRLGLRVTEACRLKRSDMRWSHGRWVLKLKVKRGREEAWPVPKDVKAAMDDYLKLDAIRRRMQNTDGADSFVFQPHTNYRTLEFGKALSSRMAHKIIRRWSEYAGIGRVSPHDLRRSVITKLLDDGRTYREVQMVTKHKDARSVQRYDHGRENLEHNPVNFLSWGEEAQGLIKNAG